VRILGVGQVEFPALPDAGAYSANLSTSDPPKI
jgi:hypothetical protein